MAKQVTHHVVAPSPSRTRVKDLLPLTPGKFNRGPMRVHPAGWSSTYAMSPGGIAAPRDLGVQCRTVVNKRGLALGGGAKEELTPAPTGIVTAFAEDFYNLVPAIRCRRAHTHRAWAQPSLNPCPKRHKPKLLRIPDRTGSVTRGHATDRNSAS